MRKTIALAATHIPFGFACAPLSVRSELALTRSVSKGCLPNALARKNQTPVAFWAWPEGRP